MVKEKQLDPVRNVGSLRIQSISQSSAHQRAGRAGRTQPGLCYRLYSQEAFLSMRPNTLPEIKRIQLGQMVLKLLSLGIDSPEEFDFIESPGRDNIRSALSQLSALGAIFVPDTASQESSAAYELTDLGSRMALLPLDPRLAKLVLEACDEGLGGDALIVSAIVSVTGSVFFRMGSSDEVQLADQKKIRFCSDHGDFITLLELYKTWLKVAEHAKSRWCVNNAINAKSLRIARDVLKAGLAIKSHLKLSFKKFFVVFFVY